MQQNLTTLMPITATGASIEGIISSVLGDKAVNILTPIDKILSDINSLNSVVSSLINSIPTAGFTATQPGSAYVNPYITNTQGASGFIALQNMSSFANQGVNLLQNLTSNIPITPSTPIPSATTDPSQILTNLVNTTGQNIYGKSGTTLSTAQQAMASLVNTIATTGSPSTTANNPYTSAVEPSQGGSFMNLSIFKSIFNFPDPTITPPNLSLSLDPAIQQTQIGQLFDQQQVDSAGIYQEVKMGDGIIFKPFNMTPRNKPLDGSLGDYNQSSPIDLT